MTLPYQGSFVFSDIYSTMFLPLLFLEIAVLLHVCVLCSMQDPGDTTIVMSSETQVQLEGLNAGYDYNFQVFIIPHLLQFSNACVYVHYIIICMLMVLCLGDT